jgi:hypothetical protein
MTRYLDEYNPRSRDVSTKVQSDPNKLKFNNIQSCIAVVLVPAGGGRMVGVHLTTITTFDTQELKGVMNELKAAVGPGACDAYLLAAYTNHDHSDLGPSLKKLARTVWLCDVPVVGGKNQGADVDVKVELHGGQVIAYVRKHAVIIKDAAGRSTPKPGFNPATALPGKPMYMTDRDDKPWMAVTFHQLR